MNDDQSRRSFLIHTIKVAGLMLMGSHAYTHLAHAMGTKPKPPGIYKLKGNVLINGTPARMGDQIKPGDTISTGENSRIIFIIGKSAFLVHENTTMKISYQDAKPSSIEQITEILNVFHGRVLSVFNPANQKKVITPTVVAGVRGSAVYVEAEEHLTYFCLCYGKAKISSRLKPGLVKEIETHHHDKAFYIFDNTRMQTFQKAPMKNHTDNQIIVLEKLNGRLPPFFYDEH